VDGEEKIIAMVRDLSDSYDLKIKKEKEKEDY